MLDFTIQYYKKHKILLIVSVICYFYFIMIQAWMPILGLIIFYVTSLAQEYFTKKK